MRPEEGATYSLMHLYLFFLLKLQLSKLRHPADCRLAFMLHSCPFVLKGIINVFQTQANNWKEPQQNLNLGNCL